MGASYSNSFTPSSEIKETLGRKVKSDVMKQALSIVGSLDIIGNPLNIIRGVRSGSASFISQSKEGMVKGPLEGGKGIVKGVRSLVGQSSAGVFNSVGRLTGTLGRGLAELTFDEEYQNERQRSSYEQPKNVREGLKKGIKGIGKGLLSGVTGVFTAPVKEAKKSKFKGLGFLKGVGKGVGGLLTKTIGGVVDGVTKVAEGAQNRALLHEDTPFL